MSYPDLIGLELGNVKLTELLGRGAMGTVYRAEHKDLHTPYAVKILHPEFSKDDVVAERFRREAMMCSQLRHPNIVFVTDFGKHPNVGLYLVMEFLTGETLLEILKEETDGLPLWRSILMLKQLCSAFSLAHKGGVIHRDLKPENIIILKGSGTQEQVKVLDFGIARLTATEDGELTSQGQIMGTPAFMAPEQITGSAPISPQTDIYALGVLAYNIITGRTPFRANSPMELMAMHMMQDAPVVSIFRPDLKDTWLEQLIQEMMGKKPEDRPESMDAVQKRLDYVLQELQERGVLDSFAPSGSMDDLYQDFFAIEEGESSGAGSSDNIVVPQADGSEQYQGSGMFALSGMISQLQGQAEESKLGAIYRMLPELQKLPPEMFFLTSWGPVLRDLVDSDLESPIFSQSLDHLATLMETLLTSPQTSEDVQRVQHLLRVSLKELMVLTPESRHLPILRSCRHLTTHYLFPQDALPDWAQAQTTGTWNSLKDVLTRDIRDFFKKSR
ncbi:MAG: serine/threonine protein kinase [Deltaproteobacteria bacterium]|nr:MAG: serine/threonine protein kinase [Deltaproteobacteria bacterium]